LLHFYALRNEVAWGHVKWRQYRELFGSGLERIDLLNTAAPLFFRIVPDTLWEETLFQLARLTDRPDYGGGKTTLTIRALPPLLTDLKLVGKIELLTKEARSSVKFAVNWRNKHIAHRDLRIAREEPLHELSMKKVSWRVPAVLQSVLLT
jgi:hypothetical protein